MSSQTNSLTREQQRAKAREETLNTISQTQAADDGLCSHCHQRPGTELWLGEGGWLAYNHGMSTYWCKICVLETQLEHAQARAAAIPELEQELAQLRASDS